MKKRAMKKWIPKDTVYCYDHLVPKNDGSHALKYVGHCKWRTIKKINGERDYFCKYLGKSDDELGCGLLWDACKECNEHVDGKEYEIKCAKWRYKHRDKLPEWYKFPYMIIEKEE